MYLTVVVLTIELYFFSSTQKLIFFIFSSYFPPNILLKGTFLYQSLEACFKQVLICLFSVSHQTIKCYYWPLVKYESISFVTVLHYNILLGSIKTRCMTMLLLASKCSQTVESVGDIGNHLTSTTLTAIHGGCLKPQKKSFIMYQSQLPLRMFTIV